MKIIYLTNSRIPTEKAHGLQIMKMVEAFREQGVETGLVVAKRVNNQLENIDPFSYYGIKNRFLLKKIWLLDLVDISFLPRRLSVFLQNTSFAISSLFYLGNKKVDLIYSRDEFSLFLLCLFKKNLVLELHTFPNRNFLLYKFLFRRVKMIVVITSQLKKLVCGLDISEKKVIVAPDGVDLAQFQIKEDKKDLRQKLNLPLDKKIVLYTGHLFAWKGVYTLAAATKFLPNDYLTVFVGGMEYDINKFQNFIETKQLKNIMLVSHRPPTEIPRWLKTADCLVLPNSGQKEISKFYTSPMKLFEYLAAAKPIVASDLPAIREVLNENNAILVGPDDPQSLAEGIKKALQNPALSDKIVQEGFLQAQKYSWSNRAKIILDFLKNYYG